MLIKNMMDLTGRVAIVTGGTGWLGSSICEALCEMGMTVYATSRGKSKDFSDSLQACEQFKRIELDMSVPSGPASIVTRAIDETGRIDVIVNNAYSWPKEVNFEKADWERVTDTLDSGVTAPLMMIQATLPHLVTSGKGSIINVASMYSKVAPDFSIYRGTPGMGTAIEYGASKAALVQATRYIASLVGKSGVRCNSISPGPFPRPNAFDGKEWFKEELEKKTLLGRVGRPEEIKGLIAFLASDMSSYVTGVDFAIDGGWTAF